MTHLDIPLRPRRHRRLHPGAAAERRSVAGLRILLLHTASAAELWWSAVSHSRVLAGREDWLTAENQQPPRPGWRTEYNAVLRSRMFMPPGGGHHIATPNCPAPHCDVRRVANAFLERDSGKYSPILWLVWIPTARLNVSTSHEHPRASCSPSALTGTTCRPKPGTCLVAASQ